MVIENGTNQNETGGLEDALKTPDGDSTAKQLALKSWFHLCDGKMETMLVEPEMGDLVDSIAEKIRQLRLEDEHRKREGTAEGEDLQRRGQEVRDLASGAVAANKEQTDFEILDYTLRHDLANLVLNTQEFTDDERKSYRYVCH